MHSERAYNNKRDRDKRGVFRVDFGRTVRSGFFHRDVLQEQATQVNEQGGKDASEHSSGALLPAERGYVKERVIFFISFDSWEENK